jgi:hypothetical protein
VPAGYEQLRVFKEALTCLPEDVETVRLKKRSLVVDHDTRVEPEYDDEKAGTGTMHGSKKDESHPAFHHQSAGPSGQTVPSAHIEDLQRPTIL